MKGKSNLIRRVLSFVAAIVMTLSMMGVGSMPVMAEGSDTYSITVDNSGNSSISISEKTYYVYKLFDVTYTGDKPDAGTADERPHAYTMPSGNKFRTFIKGSDQDDSKLTGASCII